MRWIFKYDQAAAKYLGSLLHKKMPESQPWLHVAVKTVSGRNPWSGIAVYIWDSRQVIFEYRQHSGTNSAFDKAQFTKEASGMTRAFDNREPLVGGRKDINEFFEFGKEFDASHGEAFDGPERQKKTPLYKRRNAKMPGTESELSVVANNGGRVDLSKYKVIPYVDDDNIWHGIVEEDSFFYLFQDDGTMIDVWEDAETLIDEYNLHELVPANEMYEIATESFTPEQRATVYDKCYSKCKDYVLDIASAMHECLVDWAKDNKSKANVVSVEDIVALVRDALNSPEGYNARGRK